MHIKQIYFEMNREDKNEIIWRLRQETGRGLMDIEKGLDALIRMPHMMDVAYDLKFEWKPRDMRKSCKISLNPKKCCISCIYSLIWPCSMIHNTEVQDFLSKETSDEELCPERIYNEY